MAAEFGFEPKLPGSKPSVLPVERLRRSLVAGVRVELTVAVLMRHTSRPCSIPASKVWRLVVDSHHSLRLFRPTLELSQLPSRVLEMLGGWSRICADDLTFMRRLLYYLSYPALNKFGRGVRTRTSSFAPRARAVAFCRVEP